MFDKSEYVVCGNKGVCRIEDIATLDMGGVDKSRVYYILKPVYANSSTVYLPVDTAQSHLREVISKEDANTLLDTMKELELLKIRDERNVEMQYKESMQSGKCIELAKLLKTVHARKKARIEKGTKITAVDMKYHKLAEDTLSGELAVALGISKQETESIIESILA